MAPIEDILRQLDIAEPITGQDKHEVSVRDMCRYLDIPERQWHRWKRTGLSWWLADQLATKMGLHPCRLWPEWEADVYEAIERQRDAHRKALQDARSRKRRKDR